MAHEIGAVPCVDCDLALRPAFARTGARIGVSEALLLRTHQGRFLHQNTLPLVTSPCPAESYHDAAEYRILGGAPRQCRIATRDEYEMPEIGARHAQRSLTLETEPVSASEFLAALGAGGVTNDFEHYDVGVLARRSPLRHCPVG